MRFVHKALHVVDDLRILVSEILGFTEIIFQIVKFDRMKTPALLLAFGDLHGFPVSLAK